MAYSALLPADVRKKVAAMNVGPRALRGACLVLILCAASPLRFHRCTAQWAGGHLGYNGALYSTYAHNHLERGLLATGFLPARNASAAGGPPRFNMHHPPLLGVMVAGSFYLFGESEFSARLVPILFSLGSLVMLSLLVAPLWGWRVALLACFFGAFMPMDSFYGPQVEVFGSAVVFFILCSYVFYRRWRSTALRSDLCASLLAFLFAVSTEWTGYYLLILVLVEEAAGSRRAGPPRRAFLLYLAAGMAAFAAYLGAVRVVTGAFFGGGWVDSLLFRLNIGPRARQFPFTTARYLRTVCAYLTVYFGYTALALSALGLVGTFGPAEGEPRHGRRIVALNLLVLGWAHPVVFRNAVYLHDYTLFNLTPVVSLLAAVAAAALWDAASRYSRPVGYAVLGAVLALHASAGVSGLMRLHATAKTLDGARFGGFVRAHALPGDTVLSSLPMRPEYSYYAGRNIVFDVRTTEEFSAASSRHVAAWYVARTVPEGEGERRLVEWLSARYRRACMSPYRLFDLRSGAAPKTGM
jgi:hypothetical protein